MLMEEIVFLILLLLSVCDICVKKIPVPAVVFAAIAAFAYHIVAGSLSAALLTGLIPGVAVLVLAFFTKESIGTGDGLTICAFGMLYGFTETVAVFGMALFLSAAAAMVLLVLHRAGRKTELPFIPFFCGGYVICLLW